MTTVKVKKLRQDAEIPRQATPGAACFDLVAATEAGPHPSDRRALQYGTGLAFEIPSGFVMLVFSRSGHGFNHGVRLSNCVGVIDSDYRGEVVVSLRKDGGSDEFQAPRAGERIAQAMILPIPAVQLVEADELSDTERGTGGLGSTGA